MSPRVQWMIFVCIDFRYYSLSNLPLGRSVMVTAAADDAGGDGGGGRPIATMVMSVCMCMYYNVSTCAPFTRSHRVHAVRFDAANGTHSTLVRCKHLKPMSELRINFSPVLSMV